MTRLLGSLERAVRDILDQASAGDATRRPPGQERSARERLRRCFPESRGKDGCYPEPQRPEEGCYPEPERPEEGCFPGR